MANIKEPFVVQFADINGAQNRLLFLSAGYGRVYLYNILIFHGLMTGHHLALPDSDNAPQFYAGIPGDPTQQVPQIFRCGQRDLPLHVARFFSKCRNPRFGYQPRLQAI